MSDKISTSRPAQQSEPKPTGIDLAVDLVRIAVKAGAGEVSITLDRGDLDGRMTGPWQVTATELSDVPVDAREPSDDEVEAVVAAIKDYASIGHCYTIARAALSAMKRDQTERGAIEDAIKDPNAVHVNLLRGSIARPSPGQIWHIYQRELLADMPSEFREELSAGQHMGSGKDD